uniref:Uncharacterized protein n=1 Tax=Oryza rufipogon TaxID=4529 RepID=A0A0E0PPS1_ORYRU
MPAIRRPRTCVWDVEETGNHWIQERELHDLWHWCTVSDSGGLQYGGCCWICRMEGSSSAPSYLFFCLFGRSGGLQYGGCCWICRMEGSSSAPSYLFFCLFGRR